MGKGETASDIALPWLAQGDRDAHGLLAKDGPGQVFAARGRDLMSDQL
jgi:hypothetical protein